MKILVQSELQTIHAGTRFQEAAQMIVNTLINTGPIDAGIVASIIIINFSIEKIAHLLETGKIT